MRFALPEPAMSEPSGGDPFVEGMDAFGRGVPLEARPYPEGSDEQELWLLGWDEAKRMNEDRGSKDGQ
jgi:hypothetical protein